MDHIELDDLVKLPLPGTAAPHGFRYLGDRVTFFETGPGSMVQELWAVDVQTGARERLISAGTLGTDEAALPLEERLRRERLRERALGVTVVRWSAGGELAVVPLAGEVWVKDGQEGELRHLVAAPALDPRPSPDGRLVAFVRDAELCVADARTGVVRELTTGARGTGRTHGLAEYVAQEEMNRHTGYWWSEDARYIAYAEVDETHIPIWRIPHEGRDTPSWEDHRYPFAGAENAVVRLHVVRVVDGRTLQMTLPDHEYLCWVRFLPDGRLIAAVQDRRQTRLDLVMLDPETGEGRVVLTETSDVWINLHHILHPLRDGALLWASERTGFQHLERVDAGGARMPLTSGPWMVEAVAAVDEEAGFVWVVGTLDGPLERHLYRVPLAGGDPVRITTEPGVHQVVVDAKTATFVDAWSRRSHPTKVALRSLADGSLRHVLHTSGDARVEGLRVPKLVSFRQRDGVELHGALFRPDGHGPFPLVVFVYGGPHAQRVVDGWSTTVDLRAQYLCERGIAVFKLDNRGSARRGLAFESALRHHTGPAEVADQVDGVRHLVALGVADPDRVGITGWSYGGYMTLMAMCLAPDVFRVGVSGAPVTHWDGYDTHYTERYMGLPAENPEGYRLSSVMAHVERLRGELMLVHGMLDENVHFRHTARLINALLAAGKEYVLDLYPDERHVPRKPADRLRMERRITSFLARGLGVDLGGEGSAGGRPDRA